MAIRYWLVKQEPEAYSWSQFLKDGGTAWTGIRNFQARNYIRSMKKGDLTFFYHSVSEKHVVGLARVGGEPYPDPTAEEGDWSAVDLQPVQPLKHPVSLDAMKQDPILKDMPWIKQSRLSVCLLEPAQFKRILALSGTRFQSTKSGLCER